VAKKGEKNGISILSMSVYISTILHVSMCLHLFCSYVCMYVCFACIHVVAFTLQLFSGCVDVVTNVAASLYCLRICFSQLLLCTCSLLMFSGMFEHV
jgi:hypothetical protein